MRFAITCPGCAAKFRSAKERPIGKGVECPKCGEQFYVTAENQADVPSKGPPPVAADNREDDRDRASKRRPRDEEGDEAPRRRKRNDDDDFEDDRQPRRKGGGRKKVVVILGVAGLLLFVGVGVGAYLLFFSGPSSTAKKARPPHDLPRDMFANMPTDKHEIIFANLELARELQCASTPVALQILQSLPTGVNFSADQVRYACLWKPSFAYSKYLNEPEVLTLELVDPVDGKSLAARCKLEPFSGGPINTYTDSDKLKACVMAQPRPTRLVFVRYTLAQTTLDRKKMAEIANRPTASVELPKLLDSALADVSGYPFISGYAIAHNSSPEARISMRGSFLDKNSVSEELNITEYFDLYQAKNATKTRTGPKNASEYGNWTQGNRIFEWWRVKPNT